MRVLSCSFVLIKGGGELGSGVARRLFLMGFPVLIIEISKPLAVRRCVSFAESVFEGETMVEGVRAKRVENLTNQFIRTAKDFIHVIVDEGEKIVKDTRPEIIIDARMAKKNLGTSIYDAPIVIGLGPGFYAGRDAHYVIETNRGANLGKVISDGEAENDTKEPFPIMGVTSKRVLRAPEDGLFYGRKKIGDMIKVGEEVGKVDGKSVFSEISGVLRGILHDGVFATKGMKVGDIDPRGIREFCFKISDKANAVAEGVVKAIFPELNKLS